MVWKINYWVVFFLNWFALPILMQYLEAGDFTMTEKLMRALKNVVPYLIIYFLAFIAIVIILAVTESGRKALEQ
jgi:hypothetical protein